MLTNDNIYNVKTLAKSNEMWRNSDVFIVDFEYTLHRFFVSLLFTMSMYYWPDNTTCFLVHKREYID